VTPPIPDSKRLGFERVYVCAFAVFAACSQPAAATTTDPAQPVAEATEQRARPAGTANPDAGSTLSAPPRLKPDAGVASSTRDDVDAGDAPKAEGPAANVDAGGRGAQTGAGTRADPSLDSGAAAAGSGGMAAAPTPTSACGDDLNVPNGAVVPDLGALPPSAAWRGDPAESGPTAWQSQPLDVELAQETFSGAGMQIELSAGRISGNAWLPDDASMHELVLVLPGFATSCAMYSPYAEHLASHGFIVVGVVTRSNLLMASHDTEALEVVRTLDWLLEKSPFQARIDKTKIAVAGHSKGGKVAFFAAALDARIDLVIGWDPVNGGGGPCAFDPNCHAMPVAPNCAVMAQGIEHFMRAESLVIGAPPDPDLNPESSQNCVHFYRVQPSPAALIVLATGHGAWAVGASEQQVFRITKAAHLARLLQRFRNVTGLNDYLPGAATLTSDALVIRQESK
jgi:hypothetical protein